MTVVTADIPTTIEGRITDAQLDFFGARLAIADSSGKILIQDQPEVTGKEHSYSIANAHKGEISQITWVHPQFGGMLISGGREDNFIRVWKEIDGEWRCAEELKSNSGITWIRAAPKEYGFIAIVGFEDWTLGYLTLKHGIPNVDSIGSHTSPVISISFGPSTYTVEEMRIDNDSDIPCLRFIVWTGENSLFLWRNTEGEYFESSIVYSTKNSKFVDASWWDNIGLENDVIAVASLDGCVWILKINPTEKPWENVSKIETVYTPFKVGWSGNVLFISTKNMKNGESQTEIYKEPILKDKETKWERISIIQTEG